MVVQCHACGQSLEIPDELVKVGRFGAGLKMLDVPPHGDHYGRQCPMSGRIYVEDQNGYRISQRSIW